MRMLGSTKNTGDDYLLEIIESLQQAEGIQLEVMPV